MSVAVLRHFHVVLDVDVLDLNLSNGIMTTITGNTLSYYKDVKNFFTGQFYASHIKERPGHS